MLNLKLKNIIFIFFIIFPLFLNAENNKFDSNSLNLNDKISDCEKLADDPKNPDSKSKGIKLGDIKFNKAIDSCENEILQNPKPIIYYNLSRAYIAKGLKQKLVQIYEKEILDSFEKAILSKNDYYKLKFAETLMYRFLVARDFKKALKLIDNIKSKYLNSYESKNHLLGFIYVSIIHAEEYSNDQNIKRAIEYLNKCIEEKEPHFNQCKFHLAELYVYDHNYFSYDKAYLNYSGYENFKPLKFNLLVNQYEGYLDNRPSEEILQKQFLEYVNSSDYENNNFESFNLFAFDNAFKEFFNSYLYVALGDQYLNEKKYDKSFINHKKAFELYNNAKFAQNSKKKGYEWLTDEVSYNLAALYFLDKQRLTKYNLFSEEDYWKIFTKNPSPSLCSMINRYFGNNYHGARDLDEQFRVTSFCYEHFPEDPDTLNEMGFCYHNGWGVKTDFKIAEKFYHKAYEMGHSYSAYNIGLLYETGEGGHIIDYQKALFYYKEAVNLDSENMMPLSALGFMYQRGIGVEIDIEKAKSYHKKAHELGNLVSSNEIASIYSSYSSNKSLNEAIEILEQANVDHLYYESITGDTQQRRYNEELLKQLKQKVISSNTPKKQKKIALLIGNNKYKNLENLQTPINDVKSIAKILKKKFSYDVVILKNASRREILEEFNVLRKNLKRNDKFVLYFAGHGYYDEISNAGFWLPVDAAKDNDIEWISNSRVNNFIKSIKSSKVLLLVDSCFSGSIIRGLNFNDENKLIDDLSDNNDLNTRLVITSGGNEPVLDSINTKNSIFSIAIQNVLNDNKSISASTLFDKVKSATKSVLLKENFKQTPQYSPLIVGGHTGGDFYFTAKK